MHVLLLPFEPFAPVPKTVEPETPGVETDASPDVAAPTGANQEKSPFELLSRFEGRTSLGWVARALADSRRASRISVLAEPSERAALQGELPPDRRFGWSDAAALGALSPASGDPSGGPTPTAPGASMGAFLDQIKPLLSEPTLILTCETVLLRGDHLDEIIAHIARHELELGACWCDSRRAQSVLPRQKPREIPFLGQQFEPVPLGVVGPAALRGARELTRQHAPLLQKFASDGEIGVGAGVSLARLALGMLGARFLFRAFKKRLSFSDLERAATRNLGCRAEMIEVAAPELCLRAGEPAHRAAIEKWLGK